MELLDDYIMKKTKLFSLLDRLKDDGFVPCEFLDKRYNEENINEIKKSIQDGKFTISVCGQINAGKSSFINFLLFNGRPILPADDTPWTAKLCSICYGEKNSAVVKYYSQESWEKIKKQEFLNEAGEKLNYYETFLKEDVDRASRQGIYQDQVITKNGKVDRNVSLEDLTQYVTKNGNYTPFVETVEIQINNELLKGVTFVDTPGINDRNELRSKVTTDWIQKSSAVIYLFYTGQSLSKADFDFIDMHLAAISSKKILFLVTKADTSNDYQGAVDFVQENLRNNPDLKDRNFLSASKNVFPISTLAALIDQNLKNGVELDEDLAFHLDRLEADAPEFLDNQGFIPPFIEELKKHLMEDSGDALIDKGKELINDVLRTKLDALTNQLSGLENEEKMISKGVEQLINEQNEVNHKVLEFEDLRDRASNRFVFLSNEIRNEIDSMVNGVLQQSRKDLEVKILNINSLYERRNSLVHKIRDQLEAIIVPKINNKIKESDHLDKVKEYQDYIVESLSKISLSNYPMRKYHLISHSFSGDQLKKKLSLDGLTSDALKKHEDLKVYKFVFDFTDKEKFNSKLFRTVDSFYEALGNQLKGVIKQTILSDVEIVRDRMFEQTSRHFHYINEKLAKYEEDRKDRVFIHESINLSIKKLKEETDKMKEVQAEIEKMLANI
ncbi:dynamin family protein [Nitritalea halalkaliphila]|nr:dynamin family protein [Nitritalea halalkaliphila]